MQLLARQAELAQKVAVLAAHGVAFNPPYGLPELYAQYAAGPRSSTYSPDYEYELLLDFMGGADNTADGPDGEPGARYCDQLHSFDPECIDGDGSYSELVHDIARLTGSDLALVAASDTFVDGDAGDGSGSLTLRLLTQRWQAEYTFRQEDGWVDSRVLALVAALLPTASARRLCYISMDNNAVLGYLPEAQIRALYDLGIRLTMVEPGLPRTGCVVRPAGKKAV